MSARGAGAAHGAWTPANRAELRATVAGLPTERAVEILRPLIVAINEEKVTGRVAVR